MKNKQKIIFWISTLLLVIPMLVNGVLEVMQTDDFIESITALGYPLYFLKWLGIAKITGVIILVAPIVSKKLIFLAYAGFLFDFTFAFISLIAVGDYLKVIAPIAFFVLLMVSYIYRKNNIDG